MYSETPDELLEQLQEQSSQFEARTGQSSGLPAWMQSKPVIIGIAVVVVLALCVAIGWGIYSLRSGASSADGEIEVVSPESDESNDGYILLPTSTPTNTPQATAASNTAQQQSGQVQVFPSVTPATVGIGGSDTASACPPVTADTPADSGKAPDCVLQYGPGGSGPDYFNYNQFVVSSKGFYVSGIKTGILGMWTEPTCGNATVIGVTLDCNAYVIGTWEIRPGCYALVWPSNSDINSAIRAQNVSHGANLYIDTVRGWISPALYEALGFKSAAGRATVNWISDGCSESTGY